VATTTPKPDEAHDEYEPILEIKTAGEAPPTITIDGTLYELKRMRDFGIKDQWAIERDGRKLQELYSSDELSDDELSLMSKLLHDFSNRVLDAPEKIKRTLSDSDRSAVMNGFTLAPQLLAAQIAKRNLEAAKATIDQSTTES
jgi:hypothetical protein